MKREIVVCDRCGKDAESEADKKALDLHSVILGTKLRYASSYERNVVPTYAEHASWEKEWCIECRKKTGLAVVMEAKRNDPATQVPTLEEMIREIVRQEIPEAGNQ
jgi:hypothetical protein